MTIISMPEMASKPFIEFEVDIKSKKFKFIVRWCNYCNTCFLIIMLDDVVIVDDFALVVNSIILTDKRLLPNLTFKHKDNLTIEPIIDTFNDYVIEYAE